MEYIRYTWSTWDVHRVHEDIQGVHDDVQGIHEDAHGVHGMYMEYMGCTQSTLKVHRIHEDIHGVHEDVYRVLWMYMEYMGCTWEWKQMMVRNTKLSSASPYNRRNKGNIHNTPRETVFNEHHPMFCLSSD